MNPLTRSSFETICMRFLTAYGSALYPLIIPHSWQHPPRVSDAHIRGRGEGVGVRYSQ